MDSGAYVLLMENPHERRLHLGSLGDLRFPPGIYVYVGSAKSGLEARIDRHLDPGPRPRQHIDHVTPAMGFVYPIVFPGPKAEGKACALCDHVARLPDALPVLGFGATDCDCLTHLYGFLGGNPDAVREAVEAWRP